MDLRKEQKWHRSILHLQQRLAPGDHQGGCWLEAEYSSPYISDLRGRALSSKKKARFTRTKVCFPPQSNKIEMCLIVFFKSLKQIFAQKHKGSYHQKLNYIVLYKLVFSVLKAIFLDSKINQILFFYISHRNGFPLWQALKS